MFNIQARAWWTLGAWGGLAALAFAFPPPTVDQALLLNPVQKDVEFDRPAADQIAKCTIDVEKGVSGSGWVVKGPAGETLRRFLDTDGNNVVDLWCYYKSGLEAYRDIDNNHNGKADQYRWLGSGGSRWGLDTNEDGIVDLWKTISAEETTAEIVLALANKSSERFRRVLLTADELKSLGLGPAREAELSKALVEVPDEFAKLVSKGTGMDSQTTWSRFDALRPSLIPVGQDGATKDILIYDNVLSLAEAGPNHKTIQIGTLVRVGEVWKAVNAPRIVTGNDNVLAENGFSFLRVSLSSNDPEEPGSPMSGKLNEEVQKLLSSLEILDKQGAVAANQNQRLLYQKNRMDLLVQLIQAADAGEEREQWIRQLVDTMNVAVQDNQPGALARMQALRDDLKKDATKNKSVLPYVEITSIMAEYGLELQKEGASPLEVQTKWLKQLEDFVTAYPTSTETSEALLQLGVAQELSGEEEKAKTWFKQAFERFPSTPSGRKAAGAARRLDCVGKPLELIGKDTTGRTWDLSKVRGKLMLVNYWATWCDPCKENFTVLKDLQSKYGNAGFLVVGVSLDNSAAELQSYLAANRWPWITIYEDGGLESRLAHEMGVLTLPTMMLVDASGRIVNRNVHISQVEAEIRRLLNVKK